MAPIRPFISCRAQVPCVHKSFKTVSQLLENPYLYFCLANAESPSQFACYPKAVRTGAPPKIKHRTPQSQSHNGAVAENRTHRSARVAVHAATPNRLCGAKTRPQIVKKTLIGLHYPNYALLTCGF